MKYLLQQSRIQHLLQRRNGYLALAGGSLLVNVLLAILLFCMLGRERIVVLPPDVPKPFWLTSGSASPDYLAEMALYFTYLNFNVTPSNAIQQHAVLLRYVAPAYYSAVKMKLADMEDKLKKEHITMAFQPAKYPEVDSKQLFVKVTGDLQCAVGDVPLPLQHVAYRWGLKYSQGYLRIVSFEEEKKNA